MPNKNDMMVVAYYVNEDAAEGAAADLKKWDKANDAIKLGAIAIVTLDPKSGELDAKEVGQRKTKRGALWGTAVGAAAGLLTGGLALIPAMLVGAGGGGVLGSMMHKKVGMSDEDREQLMTNLRNGGAALVVMADDFEVEDTKTEMVRGGGKVVSYTVPEKTHAAISEATEAQTEAATAVDEAVAAVPEETAATEAAVSAAMPGLSAEGAKAVAALVAATSLSSEDAAKLQAAGIEKGSELLGLAATPKGRKELEDSTGIGHEQLLGAVKKMDLMRIHGVGVKHSALLLAAGVDTVPELAQRNPMNLRTALVDTNTAKQVVADLPKEAEVADWVASAKGAPRIITY